MGGVRGSCEAEGELSERRSIVFACVLPRAYSSLYSLPSFQ